MIVGTLVRFSDHPKERALTQLCFDAVEFAANPLVFRITPVIKRESFVASRAEVVVTPRFHYSGCAHLLIAVIPGFLPKNHEKLGPRVLLVGRFVRAIWSDVSWLVTDVTCASFRFNVLGSRRS